LRHIAIAEVTDDGATIPAAVLRALNACAGDTVAFIANDEGSISLMKGSPQGPKRSVGAFAGIFATGEARSLEADLALMREIRHGDEREAPCGHIVGWIGARDKCY